MEIGERERETDWEREIETCEMMNEKMIGEKRERNREGERYVERERER